jgi:hypothetical protein
VGRFLDGISSVCLLGDRWPGGRQVVAMDRAWHLPEQDQGMPECGPPHSGLCASSLVARTAGRLAHGILEPDDHAH